MKILIVGFAKIKYMPYLNLYLQNIDRKKNEIHLLYWNRDLKDEDTNKMKDITLHEFKCFQEDDVPKFFKIKNFLKFRSYAKKLLNENFDFVIVMQSVPCVLMAKELIKRYKEKFIFDYRDFTYEKFSVYKKIIHLLVNSSYKTFVSSDAFRRVLPEIDGKILTVHNVLSDELNCADVCDLPKKTGEKIRISFWGFIRNKELNLEIIKKFSSDERFELHYYGREQKTAKELKSFVTENEIKNVFFHGEYKPEEKRDFIKNTDIIHNVYNDQSSRLAMTNKYYDGVIFRKPQLCLEGSFMGETAEKNGVGIMVNFKKPTVTDDVYEYFYNIDAAKFEENCNGAIEKIKEETKKINDILRKKLN